MTTNGDASNASGSTTSPRRSRFQYHRMRRASFISPVTGERSKRSFTLRDASHRVNDPDHESEWTPLLGRATEDDTPPSANALKYFRDRGRDFWQFANSTTGRGIFKCSLAYLLGSMVTFIPALASLIGDQQDSKHMVATVTVWFHPARTIGSMHLATILATMGFLFSGVVGFSSMAVSMLAGHEDMLVLGHVIVLLVFVGGGLGTIAWTKQYFGDPLVNVACSLASLGCITILIKEGAVQAAIFSSHRVFQVLTMVLMGIIVNTVVNLLVLPVTARQQLTDDLEETTDKLGELLISITRAFLSGREDDLQHDFFNELQTDHRNALKKMNKDLLEARNEHLILGSEKLYEVSGKLVDCLEGLSQDLGGLRSAALAQFALVNEGHGQNAASAEQRQPHPIPKSPPKSRHHANVPGILDVVSESPNENGGPMKDGEEQPIDSHLDRRRSVASVTSLKSPSDVFFTFIDQVGPPTKSLVYTLKQILDELPFKEPDEPPSGIKRWLSPNVEVAINDTFHSSLADAINLYRESRQQALNTLYASRSFTAASTPQTGRKGGAFAGQRPQSPTVQAANVSDRSQDDILADIEEVSACCGHFSFSLLDFAENVQQYLHILEELKDALDSPIPTWKWLLFWRASYSRERSQTFKPGVDFEQGNELVSDRNIPEPILKADRFADPNKSSSEQPWTWHLYKRLRVFRRDDIKFAIKVGLGAVFYSMPAFIASSRPFFVRWRGEWGLVSYMAVCCMTIGASNTTGLNRFIGTFIGACLAIIAWVLSASHGDANPYLLAFFGWLVANGCFYLILAKGQGPMGRFILLTYNLGALYAYSLSVRDDDHDDDEGGIDRAIWDIVLHRLVAVIVGCIWGIVVTRLIWPISARLKLKNGLSILWLRMSLVWKRDPLAMFLLGEPLSSYMDIREESELQTFLTHLDSLRAAASSEFELHGPFPDAAVSRIIERTRRMLDAFHAMNVAIANNLRATPGEAAVLRFTRTQRCALSARIAHLFSVLASSYKLEYPLNDVLPSIEHSRDALLARTSEFRRAGEGRDAATEQDFELLYAYVLVTGQLALEIGVVSKEIEGLFGTLDEEHLKLQ